MQLAQNHVLISDAAATGSAARDQNYVTGSPICIDFKSFYCLCTYVVTPLCRLTLTGCVKT
jgi:hypothetical protein